MKYLFRYSAVGFSFSTNPVCFYPGQSAQQFRMSQPVFSVQSPFMQSAGGKSSSFVLDYFVETFVHLADPIRLHKNPN